MLDRPHDGSDGPAKGFGGRRSLRSPREALQPDDPPPPPKPPKRRGRPIVATASGLLSFLGIAAIAMAIVLSLGLQRISAPGPLTADRVVVIAPGNDGSAVDQLADAGVIDNRSLMTAAIWLEGKRGELKAGEYSFRQAMPMRDVIDLLVSGKQILHAVTIPEGLTSEQVVDRLRDNDVLIGDIAATPAEGTLMPETYKFARGTTRDQVIRSMEKKQKDVLAEVWEHRSPDTPIHSPYELVTLASIVEKETGRADERPRVAGVFVNRLVRGMPLQSDPTIVYGLVGGKGTLGRGILRSELEQKTPYNTYQIPGLPPGPIANPGKAAMEAVANPSRTRDIYFVADGTGGHVFAETLDQHRLNVQRWRQIEKDAKDKLAPDALPTGATTPGAPRPGQRGDNETDPRTYGAADFDITGQRQAPIASITSFPGTSFMGAAPRVFAALPTQSAAPAVAPVAQDGVTTFNDLNVEVGGLRSRADPSTWEAGDPDATAAAGDAGGMGGAGSMTSFPVSNRQLADQRAKALAYGLQPAQGLPAQGEAAAAETAAAAPTDTSALPRFGKGRVIDASEGTSFDPLRDRSYDLSTAKVVPAMKALPSVKPLAYSQ